ncbi:MAG: hypothetical protein M1836_001444 [Candelina mexicana]|nr:MAG: hypothetical protein M1836_001444 [Candelina mexicana]
MASSTSKIPLIYRFFFQTVEPLAAVSGAYLAHFKPNDYLEFTAPPSMLPKTAPISPLTQLLLSQIAGCYLLFALNLAIVLRCTSDLRCWRMILLGCLLSDLAHIYAAWEAMGTTVFWAVHTWRSEEWGNIGTLYLGAALRMAFLGGVGMTTASRHPSIRENGNGT